MTISERILWSKNLLEANEKTYTDLKQWFFEKTDKNIRQASMPDADFTKLKDLKTQTDQLTVVAFGNSPREFYEFFDERNLIGIIINDGRVFTYNNLGYTTRYEAEKVLFEDLIKQYEGQNSTESNKEIGL